MAELNARDAKLVQFLNEAHAKEAELEADLTAHISLTQKAPYKKRLQEHLRETKDHKKRVSRRIKELGGNATTGVRAPGVPDAVGELAGKGIAAVKGQVGVARAALTEQAETHLRNAREELREEYVEIGTYTAIEALATAVGDRETATLAKSIRRDEQKTADYLERLIPQLVKDLVKNEIPRDQRAGSGGRRRSSSSRKRSTTSRKRTSTTSRKRTSTTSRSSSARKSPARSTARKAAKTARRTTKAAATGARAGAKKAATSAKRSAAGSRSGSTSSTGRSRSSSKKRTTAGRS